MQFSRLADHLFPYHNVFLYGNENDSTIDDWLEAEENWQKELKTWKGPLPCDYNTESEKEKLERNSQSEEEEEATVIPQLLFPPPGLYTRTAHLIALHVTLPPAKARKRVTKKII